MRKAGRVVVLFVLSLLSTAVLGVAAALMAAVSLAATALIVPGTGTPNANMVWDYRQNFRDYYMQDTPCTTAANCALVGVNYPATFWPIPLPGWCPNLSCDKFDVSVAKGVESLDAEVTSLRNYDGKIVIAGYSQGARVVTIEKMKFVNGDYPELDGQVSFVFIGNPDRPNGGLLTRLGALGTIPILDVTTGQPTPTGLPAYPQNFPTEDWAIRWEGIADFPQYLGNPLAVVNSLLGFYYDHGTYLAINGESDPGEIPAGYDVETWRQITANPELYPGIVNIQKYGDTTYYTITPKVLPLVRPLHSIPLIGKPIADLIEPALRVIIEETGYNRNISFGQPTELQLVPVFDPVALSAKLIPATFLGFNNFLANFGLAKEIPLSPTTPITPVSPLRVDQQDQQEDELEQQTMLRNDTGDLSGARLARGQRIGEFEQQQADGDLLTVTVDDKNVVEDENIVEEVSTEDSLDGTSPDETGVDDADDANAAREAAAAKRDAAREAAKAERDAAKAERDAAREAATAKRDAAKAERDAAREAATAKREAARETATARREAARGAADSDDGSGRAAA